MTKATIKPRRNPTSKTSEAPAKPSRSRIAKKVEITADMIRAVRRETRAGTLDCKDALLATGGDVQKAILIVREQGQVTPKKVWV